MKMQIIRAYVASAILLTIAVAPGAAQSRGRLMVMGGGSSYLGVGVAEVNSERAKALNLREERGVEVTKVDEDSAAAKAGLKEHDVVLEYQAQRVEGIEQFIRLVRETPVGREVKLLVFRNGSTQTVTATIGQRKARAFGGEGGFQFEAPEFRFPEAPVMPNVVMGLRGGILGVEIETLAPQLAEYFGVKEGVLIRSVGKGSAAEKAGVKAGDVLTRVDDDKVTSASQVTRAIRSREDKKSFPITVVREKREMVLQVTIDDEPSGRPRRRGHTVNLREMDL